jgi:hypothetical protein
LQESHSGFISAHHNRHVKQEKIKEQRFLMGDETA